jgi:Ca-activated chloride channel family protein
MQLSANGLLMPTESGYPYDFLRNTVTNVNVEINGLVAETSVYQEFENEWYDTTDAVYSFPLPPDARAVKFLYWYNDTLYSAVLKVKEQATNPGTGEGGVAALVNDYIGRNGIKIYLKNIRPGDVQKVELRYISVCDYFFGKAGYKFPLGTGDFIDYPLDNLSFNISINSNSAIKNFEITTHENYKTYSQTDNYLLVEYNESKAYINTDFEFYYEIEPEKMSIDFYSIANDSSDGHFALFVKPQTGTDTLQVLPKRMFFLLSNSTSMVGYKLDESIDAIKTSLDSLSSKDYFNIVLFNYSVYSWNSEPVKATNENISSAKAYLDAISTNSGSDMDEALKQTLSQITDDNYVNSILIFTNGRSQIDPEEIETMNIYKAGIYPVGIGDDLDRAKLEMTASLNYGFVTYIDDDDNIKNKISNLLELVNKPLLTEVGMEYGSAQINSLVPKKFPSANAGSMFYVAGRYSTPGVSAFSLAGKSVMGMQSYDFNLDFASESGEYGFAESLWAKMMIDALEWDIEIYGETTEKKQQLIELSLKYNIRCRYTAYIADYKNPVTEVDEINVENELPVSYMLNNYPNPFNSSTRLRFFISSDDVAKVKLIRIYNSLGQLVKVIDVTNLSSGWNEVQFHGIDQFGNTLASGIYFAQLTIDGKIYSTIKMNLLK